jgi:glutaminase
MINFDDMLSSIYNKLKNTKGGKNADYIPELKKVNPKLYAISFCTVNGDEYSIGDDDKEVVIESCSKIFTLALALEKHGIHTLRKKIGEGKTLIKFNSINEIMDNKLHTFKEVDIKNLYEKLFIDVKEIEIKSTINV